MSRILPSTLLQQQSFKPDWVISSGDFPSYLIISIQFTTTSNAPIYLDSINVKDGFLSISFSQDENTCAFGQTDKKLSIIPLEVMGSVLSATIETGIIPPEDINISLKDAIVNSSYINVVSKSKREVSHVTINQDGDTSELELLDNVNIQPSAAFNCVYDKNTCTLTISMSDSEYLNYTRLDSDIIIPDTDISTINGVKANNGKISINIYNEGKLVPVKKLASNWVELRNSDTISFCQNSYDLVDKYISPNSHVDYHPLDDMYDVQDSTYIRNTEKTLNLSYGGLGVGTKVGLFDVDINVDNNSNK